MNGLPCCVIGWAIRAAVKPLPTPTTTAMTSKARDQLWVAAAFPPITRCRARRRIHPEGKTPGRDRPRGRRPENPPARPARRGRRGDACEAAAATDNIIRLTAVGLPQRRARQTAIIRRKLARVARRSKPFCAFRQCPGCSEHHTGRAPRPRHFRSPHAGRVRWPAPGHFGQLGQHAARFGFQLSYPRRNRQEHQL